MKKTLKLFFILSTLFFSIFLTACDTATGSSSNSSADANGQLQMSSLVYLPKTGSNSATTLIYNGTNVALTLNSATINGQSIYPNNTVGNLLPTNVTTCTSIAQNTYCSITIGNNSNPQNLVLNFIFVDKAGNKYTSTQNIIYTDENYLSDNFYLIGHSNDTVNVMKIMQGIGMSSLTFGLNADYSTGGITVTSSNAGVTTSIPQCSGYTKGSLCTVNLTLDNTISDNTLVPILISGKTTNISKSTAIKFTDVHPTLTLNVNVNDMPNLIASPTNVTISPANGLPANAQTVTLINTGTANAILGTILAASPVTTTLNTCTVGATLAANGGSCTFTLNAKSDISGNAKAIVSYADSSGKQYPNILLNVTYITATPGPNQSITVGSSSVLTNTVIGITSILPVTITNTGTVLLESITFYPTGKPS